MRWIRGILKGILAVILVGLLCTNLYLITARIWNNDLCPKVLGYGRLIVASGSMEPTLATGDLIVIHEAPPYQVGDIITYRVNGALITHRLIQIDGTDLICKGDANNGADQPVPLDRVEGKVVLSLPGLGSILSFCKTPAGFLVMCLLGAALIVAPGRMRRWKERRREY